MSILIKGMEMPKDKSAKIIIRTNGNAWLMSDGGKWLEVVEIPTSHGRLIDADALKHELMVSGITDYYGTQINIKIDGSLTIIEAEVSE